jgi:cobalt/nickel transport system ATP-binding protein
VGLVFQDASTQLFAATVYQELAFGPCNLDLPEASVKGRVEEILERLNIADLKDKPTHFLSGGEKKKVAIASVLTMRPEVVIFDEPFANLDPKSAQQIGHIIDSLNQAGKTIVVATHDVDMIYSWADYVYVLHRGKLLGEGTPRAVFTDVTLIDTAHLVKPWIVEVYEECLDGQPALKDEVPVPEDKSSLFGLIKTLMSGDRH